MLKNDLCVFKQTSSLGNLVIKPVNKDLARDMIITNHYSHKWNFGGFGVFNFGIFRVEEPDRCLGVAVYGYMKNQNAKIFSHPNKDAWMCELNRLWIDDCLGKNAETVLIAASIKLIRKIDPNVVAVQSFADGRLGCGTIYKAANFKYYGFHYTRFLCNKITGEMKHEQTFTNSKQWKSYLRLNTGFLLDDFDCYKVKTYRYVFPLDKRFKMSFKEQPYPEYDKGMEAMVWVRNKQKIVDNIISTLKDLVA